MRKLMWLFSSLVLAAAVVTGCSDEKKEEASKPEVVEIQTLPVPQVDSAIEAIETFTDFSAEDDNVIVLNEDPLHLKLTPTTLVGELPEVIEETMKRALLDGVFKPFIHSDIERIQVTVQPLEFNHQTKESFVLDKPVYTVDITREKALSVAQELLKIKSLDELVKEHYGIWLWSDLANKKMLFNDQEEPGLDVFIQALGVQ